MWALAWKFVTPVILVSISVLSWVNHVPMKYGNYEFPAIVETFGWFIELLPIFIVLFYPIIPLYNSLSEGFRGQELYDELFKPTEVWYTTQMDRRMAELKTAKSSKQAQINEGYELDNYKEKEDILHS